MIRGIPKQRRDELARQIKKDRRYFQPLGYWEVNRLIWQIILILEKK